MVLKRAAERVRVEILMAIRLQRSWRSVLALSSSVDQLAVHANGDLTWKEMRHKGRNTGIESQRASGYRWWGQYYYRHGRVLSEPPLGADACGHPDSMLVEVAVL